jgi:hypothetical protein
VTRPRELSITVVAETVSLLPESAPALRRRGLFNACRIQSLGAQLARVSQLQRFSSGSRLCEPTLVTDELSALSRIEGTHRSAWKFDLDRVTGVEACRARHSLGAPTRRLHSGPPLKRHA